MAAIDLIIPLYNRSELIDTLVNNLEKQKFKDFRVIFVDDGSTDDCYAILKERLKSSLLKYLILQQVNQGPSAARNLGMAHADAHWIAFMDNDDMLLPEYLEYLYRATVDKKVEMVFCHLQMIPMGNESETIALSAGTLSVADMTAAEAMKKHYHSWISPCCLLLNRQFINDNNLRFDVRCRYCEDLMFITKCIASAQRVCEVQNTLYIYFTHQGSLLRSNNTEKYLNGIEGFKRLEDDLHTINNSAAELFKTMGHARFYLAILRKAALQMTWKDFRIFAKQTDTGTWYGQISKLPVKQKLAGNLYRISGWIFYQCVRTVFSD